MERLLLTSEEARAALGVSHGAWYARVAPQLPAVRIGRSVRYRRVDVEALVDRLAGSDATDSSALARM